MTFHGSCAALDDDAVLLLGVPGAGKSDLLLRLIDRGFALVADDRFLLDHGRVTSPQSLAGLLEVRGIGIFEVATRPSARLRLAAWLGGDGARLPAPDTEFDVPLITLDSASASAALRVHWALDAACGRRAQRSGAFAA